MNPRLAWAAAAPRSRAYLELTKPRVVALMLFTAFVGMVLAPHDGPPWAALIFGSAGIALMAASGAAANHLIDARIDALMARTRARPLPQGLLKPAEGMKSREIRGGTGPESVAQALREARARLRAIQA